MRFCLIDRIVEVQPGKLLRGLKNLTGGEDYLADHFPSFPVMPGVLQLQALVEAATWLLRFTEEFRFSTVVLRQARNVKYGTFVEPGQRLDVTVELQSLDEQAAVVKGRGEVEGQQAVTGKLTLARYNLRDRHPELASADDQLVQHWKERAALLRLAAKDMAS
jgi:3-hydroxyacyl-[acyl-carrier-protein] dehydratase